MNKFLNARQTRHFTGRGKRVTPHFAQRREARDATRRAVCGAVEQLESRVMLSIAASLLVGPYNVPGEQFVYDAVVNGQLAAGSETQTVIGPVTFNGNPCFEKDTGVTGGPVTGKSYFGTDSSGDFVTFGDTSELGSQTQMDVYSPYRLGSPAVITANTPYSNSYTDTTTITDSTGVTTSTSNDSTIITLTSETPVSMTVPAGTFNAYEATVAETDVDSVGDTTTKTSQEWFAPHVGLIQTTSTGSNIVEQLASLTPFPTSGNPAKLAFTAVPSSVVPGAAINSAVTVAVEDANNSPVATDTSTITLAIATGPAGAVLGGSLTAAAVNGVATFSNLSFSLPGAYTLQATDGALTPATSAAVTTFTPSTIGGLDPSFGVNGLAAHNVGFTTTAGMVVQGDGKSVIAGTGGSAGAGAFGITRYNADGTLDTTFGTNGVTITALPGDAQATAELLLSNGDILVAGTDTTFVNGQSTGSQFALAEYTSAGTLDTTFGNGAGYVLTSFSATSGTLSNDAAHALAVGPDGTIYLGGSSDAAGHGLDFAIAAYTSSGAPSSSFGTNGQVLLDFMGGNDSIGALAFGLKGVLIVAGSATDPSSGVSSVALAEFLPTGALNAKFGAKGKLTTSVGGVDDAASALAIGAKGAIVVGGYTGTGSASAGTLSSNFLLLRYDATGKLDKTFGSGGIVTTSFNQPAAITNLLIGPAGTIVASGKTAASLAGLNVSQLELAAARYTEKGRLDTSYDGVGQAIYNLSTAVTTASLTTLPGGKEQPAIATSTSTPFDATSDLMSAFMQLTQSDQGVIAMTAGGDLLDAANNGANTVEAAIVSMGLDLAATLNASLPASIIGGGKGTASVNIAEVGTELAAGTFTIELFASSIASQPAGQTPFQTFPEKLTLKEGMAKTLKLKFQYPSSLSKGNYYLVATVDTGTARDLNIANNASASTSAALIAPAFVQLSGGALTAPTFNGAKPASVSITLTNAGNITASAMSAVQFFASTTGTLTGAISMATTPLKLNLKPNAAHVYKVKLALPAALPAGTYMLVALLDPANVFKYPNAAMNFIVSGNTFVVT